MALKIYLLKLKDATPQYTNKRKVEHLFVKHSGIKIFLPYAVQIISRLSEEKQVEVAFNSSKIDAIKADFLIHSILVLEKVKEE